MRQGVNKAWPTSAAGRAVLARVSHARWTAARTPPSQPTRTSALRSKFAHHLSYGHHGALNTHRELHTMIFAAGAGVPRGSFGEISQTKIARFVSLGMQPPNAAE
jgi:hypothetical protein